MSDRLMSVVLAAQKRKVKPLSIKADLEAAEGDSDENQQRFRPYAQMRAYK